MGGFRDDLKRCGIRAVTEDGDVVGVTDLPNGFSLRITPGQGYFVVRIYPAIPSSAAESVNNVRHIEDGTRNSTHNGTLGGLARAHGFAGGLFGEDLRGYADGHVDLWHVDAIGALDALVMSLRSVIGLGGYSAERARQSFRVAHTERWIRECEPLIRSDGNAGKIIRTHLHDDDTLDADDPRIVALRAEFPRQGIVVQREVWNG